MSRAKSPFAFKRFSVKHDMSTMRVGTDAVLLGAWTEIPDRCEEPDPFRALEIGCGCGIVSLMMAQRMQERFGEKEAFQITAIDIHQASCREAAQNVAQSPWKNHIAVENVDFLQLPTTYREGGFSMIFSNPPFFEEDLKSPESLRNLARHNDSLPFEALLKTAERLLPTAGTLSLILPPDAFAKVEQILRDSASALRLTRLTEVYSKPGKPCVRVLACWQKTMATAPHAAPHRHTLLIQKDDAYTAEYRDLVRDFYLWA